VQLSMSSETDLPLFDGPHVPRVRFRNAMARLDLWGALADCPTRWRGVLQAMARAWAPRDGGACDREALIDCRRADWPEEIEQAWQLAVGRSLDSEKIPAVAGGEPAAAFLLRAGEREEARVSLERHLAARPRDWSGWALMAELKPIRGAARCGFHGGPVLEAAGDIVDLVEDDGLEPVAEWILPYAWFVGALSMVEIQKAVSAEVGVDPPAVTIGDARAFAWYLCAATVPSFAGESLPVLRARQRLKSISPVAFQRSLTKGMTPIVSTVGS